MKILVEEYGDVLLAAAIAIIIFGVLTAVLPMIKDTIIPFLRSVGVS